MRLAGMPDQTVFLPPLMAEVHVRTGGIPRLINAVCDNMLLTCFAMETKTANTTMLDEVSRDMRLEWPGSRPRGGRSRYAEEPFEQQQPAQSFFTRGD
jgi:hypothetical protein